MPLVVTKVVDKLKVIKPLGVKNVVTKLELMVRLVRVKNTLRVLVGET